MEYISIPGSGKPVSRLIMGSDFFRGDNDDLVFKIVDDFLAIGGTTIDTAHVYCRGESERAIGRYIRSRGNRDKLTILTKGAHHDKNGPRVNPEAIAADIAVSLERMSIEHIELYALHRDDPNVPVAVIVDALNRHIDAGRIGAIGGSNWSWQRLEEANDYAAKHGLAGFTFSSPNLSLAKPNEPFWAGCISVDDETAAWHEKSGLPVLSWSSQARGFFTGRFSPEVRDNADMVRVFYSDANWERLRRAESLAGEKGVSTVQIALAYVLNQPFPTCALIGAQSEAELESCRVGSQIRLTAQELAWLDLKA